MTAMYPLPLKQEERSLPATAEEDRTQHRPSGHHHSSQLEGELNASLADVKRLILDFQDLEYLSSAGLRVILAAQKSMNKQGSMVVRHVNETIMEAFEVTGFVVRGHSHHRKPVTPIAFRGESAARLGSICGP